jgi:ketosteroid isomerase-like protein
MELTLEYFRDWLERYFTAWKTNDVELLKGLFAEDIVYYSGPFKPPHRGRQRIIEGWLSGTAPQGFRHTSTPIAIRADTGVAHWNVVHESSSRPGVEVEIDGILVIRFDAQGQCMEHKEWFNIREEEVK